MFSFSTSIPATLRTLSSLIWCLLHSWVAPLLDVCQYLSGKCPRFAPVILTPLGTNGCPSTLGTCGKALTQWKWCNSLAMFRACLCLLLICLCIIFSRFDAVLVTELVKGPGPEGEGPTRSSLWRLSGMTMPPHLHDMRLWRLESL